jgi:hypothetical protein
MPLKRATSGLLVLALSCAVSAAPASKVKIRGYITERPDAQTLKILSDVVHIGAGTQLAVQNASGKAITLDDLAPGLLIEAEGAWAGKHQFIAEKISVDAAQFDREIKESAYLDREPEDAAPIARGEPARLQADGELLLLDANTRRTWKEEVAPAKESERPRLVGRQVSYHGLRQADGRIAASRVELGVSAPADAYKMPHGIEIVAAKDAQTGIDILEFRRGKKVEGRLKLFPVRAVQEYVSHLGDSLLPPSADVTARAIEFRFFVVEDASINATALPDGTVLVHTGLLGAMENEAQLAFVLSHEISHVLQAHYWREVHETRTQRVLLTLGALAGAYFIGDLGLFLGQLGLEAVVNGYARRIENQADRLGLQNIIALGYDARQATRFAGIMVERYGNRSTSKIWSDHDAMLLRGSFLTVQIQRQYPQEKFKDAIVDTPAFKAMKQVMGPVKIM